MRTPSLRRRLVVANTLIAAAVVTVAGTTAYLALRSMMHSTLDDALTHRAALASDLGLDQDDESLAEHLARLGIQATVETADGTILIADPEILRAPAAALPGSGGPPQRTRATQLTLPSGSRLTIELSTDGVDRTLGRFRATAIAIGALAVTATAALTALTSRHTTRPLIELAHVARRVAAGDTSARATADDDTTEVGQVATAFDDMLDEIETTGEVLRRSEETSRRLVADTAHQLRTPLTATAAGAELLAEGPTLAHQAELLDAIRSSAFRAAALSDDLLRLAELELPTPEDHPETDLGTVIEERAAAVRAHGPAPTISVELDRTDRRVAATDREVHDIVGNLVDNAVRHARTSVSIVTFDAPGGRVAFAVADDGPGLAPGTEERVFERFASLGDHAGTGLGLAIARTAARRRGGDVQWDGQRFVATLPAR